MHLTRRGFVQGSVTAGALAALGDLAFLDALPHVSAQEAAGRKLAAVEPDIEPLVRLIEDTDQGKLLEKIADKVRTGTSYQDLLAANFLAGVRGIQPRPVGFKFHAVLVINSAHLASQAARDKDRWLPLFWAIDNFKDSQKANAREGNWRMAPTAEAKLPAAHQAKERFIEAMDNWDEEGTDRAITALARTAGAADIYELFWRYGSRDFRSIGHKAIFAANSFRTLQAIGWRHAEPVLRSLAYAMLAHDGTNPAKGDAAADRPYRESPARIAKMGPLNKATRRSDEAGKDLLEVIRTGTPDEASDKVVALIANGIHPASVWDGLFLGAGELLMRQPGIVGLHCLTTVNALYYAFQTSASDETRRLLMLQGAAFLTLFRGAMAGRGKVREAKLDGLDKVEVASDPGKAIEEIFRDVKPRPDVAARKMYALVAQKPEVLPELMEVARALVFVKGTNSHDYKFSSAVLEDFYHVSPRWRPHFAAASVYELRGSTEGDNDLIRRTRTALGA